MIAFIHHLGWLGLCIGLGILARGFIPPKQQRRDRSPRKSGL